MVFLCPLKRLFPVIASSSAEGNTKFHWQTNSRAARKQPSAACTRPCSRVGSILYNARCILAAEKCFSSRLISKKERCKHTAHLLRGLRDGCTWSDLALLRSCSRSFCPSLPPKEVSLSQCLPNPCREVP